MICPVLLADHGIDPSLWLGCNRHILLESVRVQQPEQSFYDMQNQANKLDVAEPWGGGGGRGQADW